MSAAQSAPPFRPDAGPPPAPNAGVSQPAAANRPAVLVFAEQQLNLARTPRDLQALQHLFWQIHAPF